MERFFLLADDDSDDAELFSEALAGIHPPVDFFHVDDGSRVLQFLNKQNRKPDIIFLDLNMPKVGGWQCLAQLKNEKDYKDIPVIIYSTSSNQRDKKKAIESGALGFLTKPSDFKILVKILHSIANTESEHLTKVLREIN
ncbi:MAG: response regulator [Cyclobacteriaceae bacterium]